MPLPELQPPGTPFSGPPSQPRGAPASGCLAPLTDTDLYNVQQLQAVDAAIAVLVIDLEGPLQLVLQGAPQHQVQGCHVLQEVDGVVLHREWER